MGHRRGELPGLRWVDVDLAKGTLQIAKTVQRAGGQLHVQDAKTEASESVLPLPEITRRTLVEHRACPRRSGPRSPRCGRTTALSSRLSSVPPWNPGT